jgi:hypothetical protein
MRKQRLALVAVVAVLAAGALALSGCGDTLTSGGASDFTDDEAMLRDLMETDEFFALSGPYDGGQITLSGAVMREEIDPFRFWRVITEREITRNISINDTAGTAYAEIYKELWGTFNVLTRDSTLYVKPLHHTGERYAQFARDLEWMPGPGYGDENKGTQHRHGPWRLAAISGFVAQSDTVTMVIDWIHVQSASVNVTITDPLALLAVPDEIMTFMRGEEVTVTVSGPPEDALVFLHAPYRKRPLEYQGDGTFQGSWIVSRRGGHCAWIEALAHDSLFDSEYPEDVKIWGMPYEVIFDTE